MSKTRIGFALTGSFCTFRAVFDAMRKLQAAGYDITPILSFASAREDTRFFSRDQVWHTLEEITGKKPLATLPEVEPIGPKKLLDVLIVAPCTGNTLGKLASGIADSAVTLAVKAHLRNERPVVLAVSSNDALAGSAANIGALLSRRHIYFVPMTQDDPVGKPRSVVARMEQIPETALSALAGQQIQPIIG